MIGCVRPSVSRSIQAAGLSSGWSVAMRVMAGRTIASSMRRIRRPRLASTGGAGRGATVDGAGRVGAGRGLDAPEEVGAEGRDVDVGVDLRRGVRRGACSRDEPGEGPARRPGHVG
jgi:hypothetical protein